MHQNILVLSDADLKKNIAKAQVIMVAMFQLYTLLILFLRPFRKIKKPKLDLKKL